MGSNAPAVVTALLGVVEAAAPSTVNVFDGPFVTGDPSDSIHIGYDADPEGSGEAVTSERSANAFGPSQRGETVTVTCAMHHIRGDADVAAARTRAYELLDVLVDAVEANPTLGLAGVTASVPTFRLIYVPSETVGLEAWLTAQVEAVCLPA